MSSEVKVPEDREQIGGDPESLQVLKRVAKTVSSHEAWLKAEQPCFLHGLMLLPVIGKIQRLKGCYIVTGHLCEGILNGCASIKLLNINKNNEKNNVVGKLLRYLLIKYYLVIFLGIHRWEFFIGDYIENYNWKWKNI
jgi:hypothetical protein